MGKIADYFGQAPPQEVSDWINGTGDFGPNGKFGLNAKVSKAWNDYTGNTQIDKQLQAQAEENAKIRQYNMNLARKQNQWNIEQWNRENAYNTPAAQKTRLVNAGLNPDLMYGGSGVSNTAIPSPQMTSGAPASPTDWTALGAKKSVSSAIMETLSSEMMRAQINQVKADTRKTLADAGLSEISLEYADAEKRLGLKMSEQQYENCKKDYELALQAIERNTAELEGVSLDNAYKAIRNAFESEKFQKETEIFAEELKIKKAEARYALEYYAAQLLGVQADNAWKDAAWIVQQNNGVPTLIKYGSNAVVKLVDGLVEFIPKGKGKVPKK